MLGSDGDIGDDAAELVGPADVVGLEPAGDGEGGATGEGACGDGPTTPVAATGDPATVLPHAVGAATTLTTSASRTGRKRPTPARRIAGRELVGMGGSCQTAAPLSSRSSRLRVFAGSTGIPGPIVVVKKTFLRYRPLAADGLARSTSSSAAV